MPYSPHSDKQKKQHHIETLFPFIKQPWFQFLRFIVLHFEADACREKAASLTYTTMLSVVPMVTVLLVILSSVPALQNAKGKIQQLIYSNLLPSSSQQVSEYINSFAEKSTSLTLAGIVILFITTIMMLSKVEHAFNRIWRAPSSGYDIVGLMRYWTLVSLGPLVLGTAFVLSSTVASLSFLNQQVAGYAIDWEVWLSILSFILTLAGFIAIYWFIPNTRVPVHNAIISGSIIVVMFEILKTAFGIIMTNFTSYELIYGAFAALPVFLLWVYLSWCVILLGVEISYALTVFDAKTNGKRHPLIILLAMLKRLYNNQKLGKTTSERALKSELGRTELANWQDYKAHLNNQGLISETRDGHYVLKCNLSKINLWEFYKALPYPLPHADELTNLEQTHIKKPLLDSDKFLSKRLNTPLAELLEE